MYSIFKGSYSKNQSKGHFDKENNMNWKTRLCGFFMASHENPSAQRFLRSHASIDFEKRRQADKYKYIVHPFSFFR